MEAGGFFRTNQVLPFQSNCQSGMGFQPMKNTARMAVPHDGCKSKVENLKSKIANAVFRILFSVF